MCIDSALTLQLFHVISITLSPFKLYIIIIIIIVVLFFGTAYTTNRVFFIKPDKLKHTI